SRASGAPNTSPTYREYSDQFSPNWNSCTMPVAIPMPKFTISIEPKNFVIRVQASLRSASFAYTARVCMMATSSESPIVSGTKMKWYTVVMPNCHRARSRASMRTPEVGDTLWENLRSRSSRAWGRWSSRGGDPGHPRSACRRGRRKSPVPYCPRHSPAPYRAGEPPGVEASEHRLRGRPRPQCSTAGIAALPPRELRDGEGLRLPSSGTMTRRDQGALVLQKETALMADSTHEPENDSSDEPQNPPAARRRRRAGAPAGAPTFTPPVVAEPESAAPRTVVDPQDATSTEPATTTAPARRRRRAGAPAGSPVVPAENEPPVDEPAVEAVVEDEIIEDAPDTPDDAGAEDVTDENPVVDDLRALASARGAAPEDAEDEDRASRREQVQMDFASLLFQAPTPQPRTTVADQDRSDDAGAEDSDGSEAEDSPQEERSPRSRRSRSRSRRSSQRDEGIAEDSRESSSAQGGDDGDDSDDGDGTGDDSSGESRPSGN